MAWSVSSKSAHFGLGLRGWEASALAALACAAGLLAFFPPARFAFYPACPFHALTGLLCPGCGGTRAVSALLRGRFAEAWHQNALIVSLIPLAISFALVRLDRGAWPAVPRAVWSTPVIAAILFAIARNLS